MKGIFILETQFYREAASQGFASYSKYEFDCSRAGLCECLQQLFYLIRLLRRPYEGRCRWMFRTLVALLGGGDLS